MKILPVVVMGILLLSACGAPAAAPMSAPTPATTTPPPAPVSAPTSNPTPTAAPAPVPTPTPTPAEGPQLKVAVLNDVGNSVADVQILIEGEQVKQIPIYSGYWADFGSYEATGEYQLVLKVVCYHADSGEKFLDTQETVNRRGTSSIGFRINEGCISVTGYPEVVIKPVTAKVPEATTKSSGEKPETTKQPG